MQHDLIGVRLGNYEIQSALGHGGMARVYKAVDTTLKRPVAIKVIEPGLSAQDRYRDRFEREAQSIASLDHPHIVPVYYFGQDQGLYFLAMKFVEGEDLSTLMNRYAEAGEYLPTEDLLRILEGVTSALDYAHSHQVIHRDVKPSNVMIDRNGHPYLADFGLAFNLSQGTIGDILGTPHYVSPEQAQNSANAVSQSDLYSLGIVIYEMLTGVVPFDDPSPTAVALQHVMNQPPAPRALNADLSPQVEEVILKAIAKKPEDRYQSGKELITALRAALQMAVSPRDVAEIPALPLPPGFQAPPPRRPSMRSVASEVRVSLAQRAAFVPPPPMQTAAHLTAGPGNRATVEHQAKPTIPLQPVEEKPGTNYVPFIVFGGVIVAVAIIVGLVALSLNPSTPKVAILPTAAVTSTALPTVQAQVAEPTVSIPTEQAPTATLVPASETPVPPTSTSIPATEIILTSMSIPPTEAIIVPAPTLILPSETSIPQAASGPTSAPDGWLPVRFLYDADAFYWMNDSDSDINVKFAVFEHLEGTKRFEASRFAYYGLESGRCMQLMFSDVARQGCPENRRPNAFFTPTHNQSYDFWTGSGQFRVLWNDVEIAVCDISAGQCSAFIPPN